MIEPNFFIIGAPKCGTTTLYCWLKKHPDVFLPDLKEPHYYSVDLPGLREINRAEAYRELFIGASAGALVGEASASYLQSNVAVPLILARNPRAYFIAILRNPVEMAHALHGEKLANLSEDVSSFEQAWRLQPQRAAGTHLPPRVREPKHLQYREVCSIGTQLEIFMQRVPESQRLVLLMDDLRADPAAVHARLLKFLSLPPIPPPDLTPANASHRLRSRRLAEIYRDLPIILGRAYHPAKRLGNAVGLRPSAIMERVNRVRAPRPPIRSEFEAELITEFSGQVSKVEQLLGRNLEAWRQPSLAIST